MKTLCLISLGCNKNLVDSEVMLGKLSEYKLVDSPSNAGVVIINTCGFIQSAKQESISKILEVAKLKSKDSILVVSGCLSQRYADELKNEIKEIFNRKLLNIIFNKKTLINEQMYVIILP